MPRAECGLSRNLVNCLYRRTSRDAPQKPQKSSGVCLVRHCDSQYASISSSGDSEFLWLKSCPFCVCQKVRYNLSPVCSSLVHADERSNAVLRFYPVSPSRVGLEKKSFVERLYYVVNNPATDEMIQWHGDHGEITAKGPKGCGSIAAVESGGTCACYRYCWVMIHYVCSTEMNVRCAATIECDATLARPLPSYIFHVQPL